MKKLLLFLLLGIDFTVFAQKTTIPIDTLEQYFKEVKSLSDKDNGKTWGKKLWCPIIVIDRKTRFFVTNENDSAKTLKPQSTLFTGYFPENKIISNSTVDFLGTFWTMVAYPLPVESKKRNSLFIHEMFHRLQASLWKETSYVNDHIDKKEARILLKLEWNALLKALNSKKREQKQAISEALIFNAYRKQLYSGSDSMENRFEIGEGLAEYTGVKIALQNKKDIIQWINKEKAFYLNCETYTRSFGYYSGTMYAFLLDFTKANWRKQINANSSLQEILQKHLKIDVPPNIKTEYEKIKTKHGFDTISTFEKKRELENLKKIADYKEKILVKPHLSIKLVHRRIGFNPSNLISLDSLGTIFPNICITDDWGVLNLQQGGCLLNQRATVATINAEHLTINGNEIKTENWDLKLNESWKIETDGANFTLTKIN